MRALWRRLTGADALDAALRRAEQDRVAAHAAFLDALKAVVEVANSQAQAVMATNETIQAWLRLYQTSDAPRGWVNNDLSEALQEAERLQALAAQGFPTAFGPIDQTVFAATSADRIPTLR